MGKVEAIMLDLGKAMRGFEKHVSELEIYKMTTDRKIV